ncbi:redox-sensitive transcriptional activator SoxR [Sinomonas sp. ASV486]|uniref:Redox-sensitive transcriptional activator SoxR n=1 Tax=Sinomonas puerhi TaxID=3238584 RepID=A0AB39L3X2_9MICC|nr:redox-sensitive transcriptional activator SoxR [Sinomonas sp. ASV486]MDQ4491257.1 redox-sensitive transcriptional activator SoxR [Sinomonas sp. ASV486]
MTLADTAELTVGQLAARSGLSVSALHFYEREGLIHSRRTSGNQRRYPRSALRRVAVIKAAHRAGIPLATVAQAFEALPHDGVPTLEDWGRLSTAWREEIEDRIARLEHLRDRLDGCIGCGCLSLSSCALVNPADRLAAEAVGAPALEP